MSLKEAASPDCRQEKSRKKGLFKGRLFTLTKKAYRRFLKIHGHPREIALGFALGLFIGMSPTFGIQIALAIFFSALLGWNKLSATVGVLITNPLTAPFLYSITYLAGSRLIPVHKTMRLSQLENPSALINIFENAPGIFLALAVGGIILGIPLAIVGYYTSYYFVEKYQIKRKKKIEKQREKLKNL